MPNWCMNYMEVTGDPVRVIGFDEKFCSSGDPLMNNILPMPENISNDPVSYEDMLGGDNWYTWCNSNWGTKWDMVDSCRDMCKDGLVGYSYMTAWSPPTYFLETVAEENKVNILNVGFEPGVGFASLDINANWGRVSKDFTLDQIRYDQVISEERLSKVMSDEDMDYFLRGIPYPWMEDHDE